MNYQSKFEDLRPNHSQEKIQQNRSAVSFLLDGLKIRENVGAIFRLADAAKINHIFFYNMDMEIDKKIVKVSRHTTKYTSFSSITYKGVLQLKQNSTLLALEQTNKSIPYYKYKTPQQHHTIIIGSERHGITQELLDLTHSTVHIPMLGVNTSMNVSCATSIITFYLLYGNQ